MIYNAGFISLSLQNPLNICGSNCTVMASRLVTFLHHNFVWIWPANHATFWVAIKIRFRVIGKTHTELLEETGDEIKELRTG